MSGRRVLTSSGRNWYELARMVSAAIRPPSFTGRHPPIAVVPADTAVPLHPLSTGCPSACLSYACSFYVCCCDDIFLFVCPGFQVERTRGGGSDDHVLRPRLHVPNGRERVLDQLKNRTHLHGGCVVHQPESVMQDALVGFVYQSSSPRLAGGGLRRVQLEEFWYGVVRLRDDSGDRSGHHHHPKGTPRAPSHLRRHAKVGYDVLVGWAGLISKPPLGNVSTISQHSHLNEIFQSRGESRLLSYPAAGACVRGDRGTRASTAGRP